MSPIEWSPALAVGVPEIDAQHQELFRRAERLVSALRSGDGREVGLVIRYLGHYVADHFAAEERYMHEIGYPGLEAQRAAHSAFRAQLATLASELEGAGATPQLALTIHNWLSDWLRDHVAGMDMDIGRFAAAKRAR